MVKYVKTMRDFSGGLSEVANDNMPDNTLVSAKNAIPGEGYGIAKTSGTNISSYGRIEVDGVPVTHPVVFLAELTLKEEDASQVIAFSETDVDQHWDMFYHQNEAWHKVGTVKAVKDWFVYANCFYWLDGSNFNRWNGEMIETLGNQSAASGTWKISITTDGQSAYSDTDNEFFNNVVTSVSVAQRGAQWFFGTTNNEVVVSDIGAPWKFTVMNVLSVDSGVVDDVVKLHKFNNGILIFKKRGVFYLQGYDFATGSDIALSPLNVPCGTNFPKSVKTVENAVVFMGDNALYRLTVPNNSETIAVKNISEKKVSNTLLDGTILDLTAEVFNGVYYLAKRTEEGVKEYRYYVNDGSYWGEYTQQPYCYAVRLQAADDLFIGCDNGYILFYDPKSGHYVDTETGFNISIPFEVTTKGYDVVGRMVQDSKVKKVFVVLRQYDTKSSKFSIQIKLDYADRAFVTENAAATVDSVEDFWNSEVEKASADESLLWSEGKFEEGYWGWLDTVTKSFTVNSKCKRAQLTFRDTDGDTDQPLMIYGAALLYKQKKVKGSKLGVTTDTVKYSN